MSISVLQSAIVEEKLQGIYRRLYAHFGPQHWWPGDTPFEVIVGAILTQNTSWKNVEKAMTNLKQAGLLHPQGLRRVRIARLARLIRPSGYYNLKAKKLAAFIRFLFGVHHGRLAHLFAQETGVLREELLAVYGIGPETADSIILYAGEKPVFVVDAYTRRIMARLGLASEDATYEELQRLFMDHLPRDSALYNEYHALFVALGKDICLKRTPRCAVCPLLEICPRGSSSPLAV